MSRTRRWIVAALTASMVGGLLATPPADAAVDPAATMVISEVYGGGGNSGAPIRRDFVELFNKGTADLDLSGWSVQYRSATGTGGWQVTPLTGTIEAGGHLLVGEATGANTSVPDIDADVSGTIAMSGTAGKVALVQAATALSCTTACASAVAVVDFVGWGNANDFAGSGAAPATTNPTSVERDAARTNTADNAADFTVGTPTPQGRGEGGDPDPGDPELVSIAEIQGTGASSPLAGQTVTTRGVVTAAYPTGGFNGYHLQTEGTGGDTTLEGRTASDGIFVFSSATVGAVEVGDLVEVTGAVSEFNGLTELTVTAGNLTVLDEPFAPVLPLDVPWPATDADRELIESMLVQPAGDYTVTNTFTANQFSEVGLAFGTTPLAQPTDVAPVADAPGVAAVVADNAARLVTLDDGASTNFLGSAGQSQTPPYISLSNPLRVGAAVTFNEPVVVDYRFALWRFQPTHPVTSTTPTSQRPTFSDDREPSPADVGGDVSLASFNVLNYFTTLGAQTPGCTSFNDRTGDPVTVSGGCDPRGAWDPDDLVRQQTKIVAAIDALDADVVGLMEIENSAALGEAPDEAVATLVDALNAEAGEARWAYVPSSTELPDPAVQDVITNALIYQPAAVDLVGPSRALGTASDPGEAFSNAREPIGQAFAPAGGGEPFFVAVNHFKSKSASGATGDEADQGDGQGAWNPSRIRQAQALADWTTAVLAEAEIADAFLIGDFNSYTREDPLELLYAAGYADVNLEVGGNVEQSYSFSGLNGSLDHVLANSAALDRVTGSDIWTINSPESIALEYSRHNYHGSLFYEPGPFRSSDHDPVLVGIDAGPGVPGVVDLTLLAVNDFHGRIDGNTVAFAGTVEELRAAAGEGSTVFLGGGDLIGASLFASAVAGDQPTIDVFNALDLDVSVVGNHEFDQGFADLVDRVIGDPADPNASWPYLGANVYLADGVSPALPEFVVVERAGLRVGVVGAVTQETPTLVSPGGVAGLVFGDPVEAVNRVAGQLSDGDPGNGEADVVVAAFHEGAPAGEPSTLEDQVAASAVFARIVNDTSPVVDAIFTGHTHQPYAWEAPVPGTSATRPVVQTGNYGELVGEVVLSVDSASGEVLAHAQRNVARTTTPAAELIAGYPRVAEVAGIVEAALDHAAEIGEVVVGTAAADITTAYSGGAFVGGVWVGPDPANPAAGRDDRASESTLGNLVADALLASLAAPERGGAQIGITNPGGLRAELFAGDLTYAEANAVLPFVNNLWTTTLTGAQLVEVLEQQWQRDAAGNVPSRPYLQLGVSANVAYTFDPARAEGSRITSLSVDGVPVDPAGAYRVGTFSFLAQGGDNFRAFTGGTDTRDSGLIDRDAWIAYLGAHSPVAPDFARRATRLTGLPDSVQAGDSLAFEVAGLDLTSLGAPQNTNLTVTLDDTILDTVPVTDGTATITVTVPAGTPAGTATLVLVADPSGTTITRTIQVTPATPVGPEAWAPWRVYDTGDQVTHQGKVYEALWWTLAQTPGDPWGPWQEIATSPDGTAVWTPSRVFDTGELVTHDGRLWRAKWWTRNQAPGASPWGPWEQIPDTTTPGTSPAWSAHTTYDTGDQVTHAGKVYEALWWTLAQTPGDPWGPWQEIATSPDGTAVWTPSRVFDTGDQATHDGQTWQARWWTRNQAPGGDPWGPWQRVG
ncbi:MAG: ExeM/NucH family extracellular endonuclease [Acidimicrobiia bacterium]